MRIGSRLLTALAAIAVLGLVSVSGTAQGQINPRDLLAAAKRVSCSFPLMTAANWARDTGVPHAEVKPAAKFAIQFSAINSEEGSAQMDGDFGKFDIIVRLTNGTLHLLQMFREGALYTTTIFPTASGPGRLRAVHSRHELTPIALPGYTSAPEQYYGDCEVFAE